MYVIHLHDDRPLYSCVDPNLYNLIDVVCYCKSNIYHIYYIPKSGEVVNSNVTIDCVIHDYNNDSIRNGLSCHYRVEGDNYKAVVGGYVDTGVKVYSLYSGKSYDKIYPNMFNSIAELDGQYYIDDVAMGNQLEKFKMI
jgi:hypothetical protein